MPITLPYSPPEAKYSFTWALSIVNHALEKHSRVSESFLKFTGLDRRQLASLLATGRPEWALLRDMLRQGDKWAWKQASLGIEYANHGDDLFWQAIFTRNRANYPPKLKSYLDKQLELIDS